MFVITKIVEILAAPLNLVLLALIVSSALILLGRLRSAHALVFVSALSLPALAVLPWSDWLVAPLENRIPAPAAMPEHVDGIVVLGGAVDGEVFAARGMTALNGAAERLTALVQLARRYPTARVIYTGESGSITHQEIKEAPLAREMLESLGVDCSGVVFEAQSRTTRENAVLSKELMRPEAGEVWLLVTSAAHMPRSLGVFRAVGWQVLPYPVDYNTTGRSSGLGFSVAGGAAAVAAGLHEWGGLAYYHLRGWTDSLYPSL